MKIYELYCTDGVNTDSVKSCYDLITLLQYAADELRGRVVSGLSIDEEDDADQFQMFIDENYEGDEIPEEVWRSLAYYGIYGR